LIRVLLSMYQGINSDNIILKGEDDDIGELFQQGSPGFPPEFPPPEGLKSQVLDGLIKGIKEYFAQARLAIFIILECFV